MKRRWRRGKRRSKNTGRQGHGRETLWEKGEREEEDIKRSKMRNRRRKHKKQIGFKNKCLDHISYPG